MRASYAYTAFAEHGINMVTAHSSKGLEFEHVFVLGCQSKDWESKRDRSPFSISVLYSADDDSKEAKIEDTQLNDRRKIKGE